MSRPMVLPGWGDVDGAITSGWTGGRAVAAMIDADSSGTAWIAQAAISGLAVGAREAALATIAGTTAAC